MTELPYTEENIELVQEFINETRKRLMNGQELILSRKAQDELEELEEEYDITTDDIYNTILNLKVENYYRGIDPSTKSGDHNVCAFRANVYEKGIEIYLKYGLQEDGLEILVFSNHIPDFPMNQPFK